MRLALCLLAAAALSAQTVRFKTNLGDIDVTLLPQNAPRTVENFLRYANRGAYNGTFFHRSVAGFVIQGGGFRWGGSAPADIPQDAPILNEYNVSNTRGTIAMAKLGSGPNTATNQWFFNLADNSANLNNQNGGFTVFGRVANQAGLDVMDGLASQRVIDASSFFGAAYDSLPVRNYSSGRPSDANLLIVNEVQVLNAPSVSAGGIVLASAFGGFTSAAPGAYLEIYGEKLFEGEARSWRGSDFDGVNAPTSLDGVTVTVGGLPAFVNYVSATQINVQIPDRVPTGGPVSVRVQREGVTATEGVIIMRPLMPGLLAPASFKVGDKQYVVAQRANGTFVANGIAGVPNAPAAPGETLIFYGTGFGQLSPSTTPVAGRIAQGATRIANPVDFKIGGILCNLPYAGLAPGLVGVYQFNVVVPNGVASGDQPVEVTVAADTTRQQLYLPIR